MADATVVIIDEEMIDSVAGGIIAQREVVQRLLVWAKEQGVSLTGPGDSLSQPAKSVIETAENAELTEHLGREYDRILNG